MKRCLILTGGSVDDSAASDFLTEYSYDLIIAVDSGLTAARRLQLKPDYCVGDFDSVSKESLEYFRGISGIRWETHPPEKDETDTELALHLALRRGADLIHVFGATGTRMDHTLAAIGLLQIPLEAGVSCWMIDGHNRITMIDSELSLKRSETFGTYVSLIPFTEAVTGVTLEGFKYPLRDYTFVQGNSLGVSNEIVSEEASITIGGGRMILIESKD
ncbi:MAG: thiamine diphosphokinase [Lachnospiraceae bacterium]|nr:thiamine diphosphokinase [Lachnospiraceae bacterium]MDY4970659.1 thiamine diphosphokinase [Lachnospiraceae bacterium]